MAISDDMGAADCFTGALWTAERVTQTTPLGNRPSSQLLSSVRAEGVEGERRKKKRSSCDIRGDGKRRGDYDEKEGGMNTAS